LNAVKLRKETSTKIKANMYIEPNLLTLKVEVVLSCQP